MAKCAAAAAQQFFNLPSAWCFRSLMACNRVVHARVRVSLVVPCELSVPRPYSPWVPPMHQSGEGPFGLLGTASLPLTAPASSSAPGGSVPVVVHVVDKARNVSKDFQCAKEDMVRHMKYFEPYLTGASAEGRSLDIAVFCDVRVFEWLVEYISSPPESQPKPGTRGVAHGVVWVGGGAMVLWCAWRGCALWWVVPTRPGSPIRCRPWKRCQWRWFTSTATGGGEGGGRVRAVCMCACVRHAATEAGVGCGVCVVVLGLTALGGWVW